VNLRRRVFTIILIASAVMLVVLTGLVVLLVYTNSATVDNKLAADNATRVDRVIQDELEKINTNGVSWAYWTDANNFVLTKNQEFIDNELLDDVLQSSGLQILIYLNNNQDVVFSRNIDPETGESQPVPQGLIQYLFSNPALFQQKNLTDKISGVLSLPEGIFLVTSVKTLNSDSTGPSNGYLVVSKPLNEKTLDNIGYITGLNLSSFPASSLKNPPEVNNVKQSLINGQPFVLSQLGGGLAAAFVLLKDIQGQAASILQITFPSTVFSQTTSILRFLLPALLIIAFGYGLTINRLMNQYVVNPLTTLDNDLESVIASKESSTRVNEGGDREIKSLSVSINSLLEANQTSEAELKRSLNQLLAISDINSSISGFLNPESFLPEVANLIQNRLGLYYVGVFLLDANKEYAVLSAGTGEAGAQMIANGHRLAVGGVSMIGWSTATQKPRIALDVGKEAIRFSNPLLPLTRSELAIPIVSRNVTIGALTLQSEKERAFNDNDIVAFQSISDSLAVALENSTLFQETRSNLKDIQDLNRIYTQRSWGRVAQSQSNLEYSFVEKRSGSEEHETDRLVFPLLLRDQSLGEISLEVDKNSLSSEDQFVISSIADQTAQALENVRLLEESQQRASREETINEMVLKFSGAGSIDEIMRIAVQEIGALPVVSEVNVHLNPEVSDQHKDNVEDLGNQENES
jgi:sensor domain CHASE-containing protein/GAF domain-containing protein